jgi:hypothetical protein
MLDTEFQERVPDKTPPPSFQLPNRPPNVADVHDSTWDRKERPLFAKDPYGRPAFYSYLERRP